MSEKELAERENFRQRVDDMDPRMLALERRLTAVEEQLARIIQAIADKPAAVNPPPP